MKEDSKKGMIKEDGKTYIKGAAAGVAIGALAGAIAGILLAPKSGKETRKDIAQWVLKIKDEIAEELEKAGDFTKEKYNQVASSVVDTYQKAKKISDDEAKEIKADLAGNFEKVKKAAAKK